MSATILAVRGIVVSYGTIPALHGIDLEVKKTLVHGAVTTGT